MNTNLNITCYELVCVQDAKASIALMYENELEQHSLRIGVCVQDAKASIAPMYEHELEQHSLRIGVCVQDAKASIAPITRRK